jgi:cytidylate kinase
MSVQAIIQSTFFAEKSGEGTEGFRPMITVSGEYGAGGREVGRVLAQKLGVVCFEPELIDQIVAESMKSSELSRQLDNRLPDVLDDWLRRLWHKKEPSDRADYYLHLVKAVMGITHVGGVIVGRGAHLILASQNVFRLKIEGSREFCAQSIAKREGISVKAAMEMVGHVEEERIRFVREIYKRFPTDKTYYDLVLNREIISQEQIVDIVFLAMQMAGYELPEAARPQPRPRRRHH